MPVNAAIQFAIVREDPAVERAALGLVPHARRALLVASGGCSALTLGTWCPEVELTLLDANRAQLDLVERKYRALSDHLPGSRERRDAFGVDVDDARTLSACGNFEGLFRGLRGMLDEFVMPAAERRAVLSGRGAPTSWVENRYWPVAFSLFFADAMLETMFGPDATQHAPRGSYPGYFQRVIERGLARGDVAQNPWLHHVLLGHWLDDAWPVYLHHPAPPLPTLLHTTMQAGPSFASFDLVQLSNLFDWMPATVVDTIVARLCAECRPGTAVVLRQLNNRRPVEVAMAGAFELQTELSQRLTESDQSLFYERVLVFLRR